MQPLWCGALQVTSSRLVAASGKSRRVALASTFQGSDAVAKSRMTGDPGSDPSAR